MKAVVIAGGLGTRVGPSTLIANKHCLPIYDRPMIHYPLLTLKAMGFKEVAVVLSPPHGNQLITLIGNGSEFRMNVSYLVQTKPDGGIADALRLAEGFANGDAIAVVLGDNVMDASIKINDFTKGARIYLKEVEDASQFGVADIKDGAVFSIEEKPQDPKSNLAVIGFYLYDNTVFNKIRACRPSKRNQLEITDVNALYLKEKALDWRMMDGFWQDCGSPDKLLSASLYWFGRNQLFKENSELADSIKDLIRLTKVKDWDYEGGEAINIEEWMKVYSLIRDINHTSGPLDPTVSALNNGKHQITFSKGEHSFKAVGGSGRWMVEVPYRQPRYNVTDKMMVEAGRAFWRNVTSSRDLRDSVTNEKIRPIKTGRERPQRKLIEAYQSGLASLALLEGTEFDEEEDEDEPITFSLRVRLDSIYRHLNSESINIIDQWIEKDKVKELCLKVKE